MQLQKTNRVYSTVLKSVAYIPRITVEKKQFFLYKEGIIFGRQRRGKMSFQYGEL